MLTPEQPGVPQGSLRERLGSVAHSGVSLGGVFDGGASAKGFTGTARDVAGLHVRGAFELQKDVDRLYAELLAIHDAEKSELSKNERTELTARKNAFYKGLDAVIASIPAEQDGADFAALRLRLAEQKKARAILAKAMSEKLAGQDHEGLEPLGREAVGLHGEILFTQLRVAKGFLKGESGLRVKPMIRNAALWTLIGGYNSGSALKSELRYRSNLERSRRLFKADESLTITSAKWINAATLLDAAGRDVRNGRAGEGSEILSTLARLYENQSGVSAALLRRFQRIAGELKALSARIAVLNGANAPPKAEIKEISDGIASVRAGIPHPKIKASKDVVFPGKGKAERAQQHTLSSVQKEHLVILRHLANVEYFNDLLDSVIADPTGRRGLPNSERERMSQDLAALAAWAGRGFVRPKQLASQFLTTALKALERGDLVNTRRYLGWTTEELKTRLGDLERIHTAVNRRAAFLADYK